MLCWRGWLFLPWPRPCAYASGPVRVAGQSCLADPSGCVLALPLPSPVLSLAFCTVLYRMRELPLKMRHAPHVEHACSLKGIPMKYMLAILVLSLMFFRSTAHAQDVSFSLTVPVYQSVAASLAHMRTVLTAMGAHFETDAALGYLVATLGNQTEAQRVTAMPAGTSLDPRTALPTQLDVSCIRSSGGAEALCRDIARRYQGKK